MDNWNEIRTAAHVARLGTISAAADALGVHRATINRHIDILEAELGGKLFQRHARGFTPTELGLELLRIADATDEQFSQLHRISSKHAAALTGELVITSLEILAPNILPLMAEFRARHPRVVTRFLLTSDIMKLEYGEAHIAFRVGAEPQDPDNVVRPFIDIDVALYAADNYIAQYGKPNSVEDFKDHQFVGSLDKNPRAPALKWLRQAVPEHATAFTSNNVMMAKQAILSGNGIGFMTTSEAADYDHIVQIIPPMPEWGAKAWLVTHVDLHRSPKVQAFMDILKESNKQV